jgi:ABC-type molybdate transport system substrate-binding protein
LEIDSSFAAPSDADIKLTIKPGFDLAGALHGWKLAMADPSSVPAGKYGKAALEKLGVWTSVEKSVARPRMSGAHYFSFPGTKPRLGSSMRPMWRLIPV